MSVVTDTMPSHNPVALTKEERLRRKAESTDPLPIRLTNNYAFHWIFKKPKVCKGFLIALLHLKETDIHSVDVADQDYQKLDMCIHVGILDFSLLTSPGFHHHIQRLDNKTSELYNDKFQIHMLELSKLNDPFPEEDQELYYWAKMIAAENLEVMQMQVQDNPYRQAVFDEAKYISLNPMQRYVYLREFMAAMDYKTDVAWNREQGMAEGLVKDELQKLFSLIQKKFQKGKTLSETASELEDTEEHLIPLYKAVQQHLDLSAEQLADLFLQEQK